MAYPESNGGWTVGLASTHEEVVGDAPAILMVIFGVVGFVLLIACANVANLTLGRAAYRNREIGVRAAIGASAGRIRQQLLTESLVLGVTGGLIGTALAYVGVRVFQAMEPDFLPRVNEITLDVRVLVFALATSILTGVLFGLAPSIRASRVGATEALGQGKGVAAGGRQALTGGPWSWARWRSLWYCWSGLGFSSRAF
ncbi:MAG: FtsX-like permease family protein [Gemmatimonadetes bacterium]|nr:FtsX-like permease family protein [Gemmatimonadota bacterium]